MKPFLSLKNTQLYSFVFLMKLICSQEEFCNVSVSCLYLSFYCTNIP